MLKALTMTIGPDGADSNLRLDLQRMTVFVGPNNSGKSLILREIQQYAENGKPAGRRIVDHIELAYPDPSSATALVRSRQVALPAGQFLHDGHIRLARMLPGSGSMAQVEVNLPHLLENLRQLWESQSAGTLTALSDPWGGIFTSFLSLFTISLDGRTRFALTEPRPAGDLLQAPVNHLAALFGNDVAREKVRKATADAFEQHFVIDPTHLGTLRIRMSKRAPSDSGEEQSVNDRARAFHGAAMDIAEASDGIKAFTGLVSSLISSDFRIVLVDEPEAFLHPPLARKLGKLMATLAHERNANVFVATHSEHFLMGCVDSGTQTNIVRLTHSEGKSTARHLPHARLTSLMTDPLLRSTGVLAALFHSCAVVCEADRDRAFYEEVNTRMSAASRKAVQDGVFLRAQNKSTVRRIIEPLREMGIPAAAIVDLDIIKGTDLRDLLGACAVPEMIVQSLTTLRGKLEEEFRTKGLEMKKGGRELLDPEAKASLDSLLQQLHEYGIFVVPIGEVECWLGELGVVAPKETWLSSIFERMRADPSDSDYVYPGANDVWVFIEAIAEWTGNPNRKGIPSAPAAAL